MNRLAVNLILLIVPAFSYKALGQYVAPDVAHYRFELDLNDSNDIIKGSTQIDLAKELVQFYLNLKSSMRVDSVTAAGKTLPFSHHNDTLYVSGRAGIKTVTVYYQGKPENGLIISKNKFGRRTFFADNWPNRAQYWLPVHDVPADKASFEFVVTAPAHYDVISNGKLVAEEVMSAGTKRTHWSESIPLSTKIMVIGVARFARKTFEDSPRGIPVSAWIYPEDSTKGFYDYAVAPDMVRFYSEMIAPFPFEKLANVQSTTMFGGMENASAIFYDEKAITGKRTSESTVAHEIVHQWFGDMASEKSFAHLWLSEGFATYLTHLYHLHKEGEAVFQKRLRADRDRIIAFASTNKAPVVDTTSNLMSLLNANSYQKGGWVLHMLRMELGDDMFYDVIRKYYAAYAGGNADTRDFQAIAGQVAGRDLSWFFDQWLYRGGVPHISLEWKPTINGARMIVKQHHDVLYRLPLDVEIVTADGRSQVKRLLLQSRETEMEVATGAKVVKIAADPETALLFKQVRS